MQETENRTWDLSVLYKDFDDPKIESDFAEAEGCVNELKELAESVEKQSHRDTVVKYLLLCEKFASLTERLSLFAGLSFEADTSNVRAQGLSGRVMALGSETAAPDAKLQAAIAGFADLEDIIKSDKDAGDYAYYLRCIKDSSKYLMSDKEEAVFAKMTITGSSAWEELQSTLTSSVTADYRGEQLNLPALKNLAFDPDKAVRIDAFNAERQCCEKIDKSVAFAMNSIKLQVLNECRMRGFESPLDQALYWSKMSRKTLDALISSMEEYMPHFRRYYKAKAEYLGYEGGLPWYELYAPVGKGGDKKYTVDECRDYLVSMFGKIDGDIADVIRDAFANRWIDFFPREGKVGGAFDCGLSCEGVSRVLTNFQGTFSDVVTLAHELGHAFHDRRVFSNRPLNQSYSMPVAETASTFNELLVKNRAIAEAGDKSEKLSLIEGQLQDLGQIICDIYSRYLFETAVFESRDEEFLDADRLSSMMHEAQVKAYGDGIDESTMNKYAWLSKSHYYSGSLSFYNFPYAFGGLFGQGLYAKYMKEGDAFFPTYKAMLTATPVCSIEDAAMIAGIDLTKKEFWESGLEAIKEEIDLFCKLIAE